MFKIGDKKLIPAPLVTIAKSVIFAGNGSPLNTTYNITLNGTLLPNRGSPTSQNWHIGAGDPDNESFTEDADRFNSILSKQEMLKEALSATGVQFSYSPPGLPTVSFYGKLTSLNFDPGIWVIKCDYNAQLETNRLDRDQSYDDDNLVSDSGYLDLNLTQIGDSLQIREREDGVEVLEVNRSITATAAYSADNSGLLNSWEKARTWVQNRKNNVPFTSGFIGVVGTGNVLFVSGVAFNFIEDESIDQNNGQYTLNQRFLVSRNNYFETRQVSKNLVKNRIGDNGPDVTTITVNGTITGLDQNNNSVNKFNNASGYWATLKSNLGTLVGFSGNYNTENVNYNQDAGTIEYFVQFTQNSGTYYKHSYDVNYTLSSDNPVVTINGTLEGYTPDDLYSGVGSNYTKFDNALSGWNAVTGSIKSLAFAYPDITPSGELFSDTPLNRSVAFNKANGTITYNYTYAYTSGVSVNYQHNYTVDLSTENASSAAYGGLSATATINGQIVGLASDNNPNTKINNAKTGWNTVKSTLYTLANNEYSLLGTNMPTLASGFVRKTIGLDNRAGSLSYSVLFNNNPPTSTGLIAVEDISYEDTNPTDVFAVQIIPGRTVGPIIQNINTTTERRRAVNINLTLFPKNSAPYYWSYNDKSTISSIASGIATGIFPTGVRGTNYWITGDSESWNPKAGLYSRSMSIVF